MTGNAQNSLTHFGYEWILDTGANDHMIGKSGLMRDSKSYAGATGSIQLLNGSSTRVTQVGTVDINDTILLHNVLFVPDFKYNLLSISKFVKNQRCCVTFFPRLCVFLDLLNGKIMGIGRQRNDLYHLNNSNLQTSSTVPFNFPTL